MADSYTAEDSVETAEGSYTAKGSVETAVSADHVEDTISSFTKLDASANQRQMQKLAGRLQREQPSLLQFAASMQTEHGDVIGEAAVFYSTLVWAMFDRHIGKTLPRITKDNIASAKQIVTDELAKVEGLADKEIHERTADSLVGRQPNIYAKLKELIEEDVREEAMTRECAEVIYNPTQIVVEAFDAAIEGRRPGERRGPIVRDAAKVGRNEPCPCGSGKKYKKCCGVGAA